MMIDFHTRTSLFSNCGSRRLAPDCCPTATPAANTDTNVTAPTIDFSFIFSPLIHETLATEDTENTEKSFLKCITLSSGQTRVL